MNPNSKSVPPWVGPDCFMLEEQNYAAIIKAIHEVALLVKAAAHATVLEASPKSEPTAKPLPATALAAQHGFNVVNLRSPRR